MLPSSKPANPESPRLRSRPAVNRNGGRLACVDGGRKHRLPHKRGSSEPEGCVHCSPAATRRHAAKPFTRGVSRYYQADIPFLAATKADPFRKINYLDNLWSQ